MKQLYFHQPQDILALLLRRKWWVLAPFVALSCAIALLAFILPRSYVSSSLIVIRPREVPKEFVKDLVNGTTEERLRGIEQTVLSRTNLLEILEEYKDELADYGHLNLDQKVARLHDRIEVMFDGQKAVANGVAYFHISFHNRDPRLAQKITSKLTSLFIESDKSAREGTVAGTTEFLATELAKAEEALKQSETKLKLLKETKRYELPEDKDTNVRMVEKLGLDLRANRDALERADTQRFNVKQLIAETPEKITQTQVAPPKALAPKRLPNPKVEELRVKERRLEDLLLRYTEKNGEVATLKGQVEQLRAEIPAEDLALVIEEPIQPVLTAQISNPAYQGLLNRLRELDTDHANLLRERDSIEQNTAQYSKRVAATPRNEQELRDAIRENDNLNTRFQRLRNDWNDAKLSETLESGQQGSQFDIIDPANYPLSPVKPARSVIVLAGMVLSLVVGLVLAFAIDLLSQKVWTHGELESLLGVPILAEIPPIQTAPDLLIARKKRITFAASSAAAASVYIAGLYLVYTNQGAVLRGLDPFIQKLVY